MGSDSVIGTISGLPYTVAEELKIKFISLFKSFN